MNLGMLEPRREPYWTKIAPMLYVGARVMKQESTVSWLVRRYDPTAGKYQYIALGKLLNWVDSERLDAATRLARRLGDMADGDEVYIVTAEGHRRPCKIGFSKDARKRAARLGQQMPYRTALRFVLRTGLAKEVEAEAHRSLSRYRARGEWFDVDERRARRAVQEAHFKVLLAA